MFLVVMIGFVVNDGERTVELLCEISRIRSWGNVIFDRDIFSLAR